MKKTTRVIIGAAAAGGIAFGATACAGQSTSKGQAIENQQQRQAESSLLQDQPLPHFNYSQLRQNLIEIETARANGVQSTSFFFNQGSRDPIQSCASIGAPIATTSELSNPVQVEHHSGSNNGGNVTLGQMDPDGIYAGSSSGTYVMCLDSHGKPYANYWEGYVQTVFAPATWDDASHTVKLLGDPTYKFTKGK